MLRLLKYFFVLVLALLGIVLVAVAALFIGLNSESGRNFAVRQINHFGTGMVSVAGLGGHFPADIKIAYVSLTDAQGEYASGNNLELRWVPQALLSKTLHVTSLTATGLTALRMPVFPPSKKKASSGGSSIPNFHVAVDHLAIPSLKLGAALAGQDLTFNAAGSAHLLSPQQGDADLTALAANGQGAYRLNGAIDHDNMHLLLHIAEPPNGLLGHYAGPQAAGPLNVNLALDGPRDDAALSFDAALGDARLNGKGTLGLNPGAPKADLVLTVPSLAPIGAIAKQPLAGSTSLHLVVSQEHGAAAVMLDGNVALLQAPGPAAKLVGPDGHLSLAVTLAGNTVTIKKLQITGAGFSMGANGQVAQSGITLNTRLALTDISDLSPGINGNVDETGTITGTAKDFTVHAVIDGNVKEASLPTGPFTITIDAAHLPATPRGTVTGSGALEGHNLSLNAAFARDASGAAKVQITKAAWQSLQATADLALAAGATLPTGTANIAIKNLADFRKLAPLPLAGSLTADFAHQDQQNFKLDLAASHLVVSPSIGAIDAEVNAEGPTNALAVKLNATVAKLMDYPAHVIAAALVNIDARSLTLSSLTANWRTLNAVLRGPAGIETKPDIAVHHFALALNGAGITADGTISPKLNAKFALDRLPLSIAKPFAPTVDASGTISATAALTGSTSAPSGNVTLNADNVVVHSGPGAALPPANLAATAQLAGKTANVNAKLGVGPNLALNAAGLVPLSQTGAINVHLTGTTDLRLLDPILAAGGTTVRGVITPDITVTGTAKAPSVNGTVTMADGSVQNIGSGLSLTKISAHMIGASRMITLQDFSSTAGTGTITGHGTIDLSQPTIPVDIAINAANAQPISSDMVTENINAALTIKGALKEAMALGGRIDILSANINIPKSLPPSVANLTILNRGQKPPPPPPPPPNIALNLLIHATNQIFIRGDGLFAELGGRLNITGNAANPTPSGGFTLIRGSYALGGKTLQFTKGTVSFNGAGFMPTLDLEASNTDGTTTSTLVISGTAAKPIITLTSSPPLPSDEVLAHLLFGQGTQNLSAFQAAQLAVALAQLAGVGGGASPLDSVRNALGLDELSLGGSGGSPTVNAGRYVAPGVYVGVQQSATGQGTQATVEINLYKGLKLTTATGTSSTTGENSSSVGLAYQFNY